MATFRWVWAIVHRIIKDSETSAWWGLNNLNNQLQLLDGIFIIKFFWAAVKIFPYITQSIKNAE